MFYCDPCGIKKGWPLGGALHARSRGPCEVCGEVAMCNSVPSSELPLPPEEPKTMPCFVVFENDSPEIAFFDEYAAKNEVDRRNREKHLVEGRTTEGVSIYIHIHEVKLVDRRKSNRR